MECCVPEAAAGTPRPPTAPPRDLEFEVVRGDGGVSMRIPQLSEGASVVPGFVVFSVAP